MSMTMMATWAGCVLLGTLGVQSPGQIFTQPAKSFLQQKQLRQGAAQNWFEAKQPTSQEKVAKLFQSNQSAFGQQAEGKEPKTSVFGQPKGYLGLSRAASQEPGGSLYGFQGGPDAIWVQDPEGSLYSTAYSNLAGGNHLVIRVDKEGAARYWVRGAEVTGENIDRSGSLVILRGENGTELARVEVDGKGRAIAPANSTLTVRGLPKPTRPAIGVQIEAPQPVIIRQLGLGDDEGVVITKVYEGQPAEEAGLRAYDVLVAIDGQPVTTKSMAVEMARKQVGDTVTVEVLRGGQRQTIEVEVGKVESKEANNFFWRGPGNKVQWNQGGGSWGTLQTEAAPFVDGQGNLFWHRQGGLQGQSGKLGAVPQTKRPSGLGDSSSSPELEQELERLRTTLRSLERTIEKLERENK